MGFTVYYKSSPLSPELKSRISQTAEGLAAAYGWMSCEPIHFFHVDDQTVLRGGSKPFFGVPDEDELDELKESGLPDGTLSTVIEILCTVSRDYHVEWEINHDSPCDSPGRIVNGVCDSALDSMIAEISAAQQQMRE